MKVGIIGLGNVGLAIAHNLIESGFDTDVYCYNRTSKKNYSFSNARATVVPLDILVLQCDVIVTALTDGQVIHTLLMASNLYKQMKRGAVHLCVSTIAPSEALQFSALHQDQGHHFVAAPILGRSDKIQSRQAMMLLAGNSAAKQSVVPLIHNLGFNSTVDLGESIDVPFKLKLCLNFFMAGMLQVLGESLSLTERMNLPAKDFYDILTASPLDSTFLRAYAPSILQREFEPAKFSINLALKDMRLVQNAALGSEDKTPLLRFLACQLEQQLTLGRGHLDWSAISLLTTDKL